MHTSISAPPCGAAVNLSGVRRVFDAGVVALDSIDLQIGAGEFVAILGPSGCGKSTLLRLIADLDRPTAGTVHIATPAASTKTSIDQTGRRSPVAYVFQDAHLLPWRDLLSNVALPLELMGISRPRRLIHAAAAIEQVGLSDAAHRYPSQLSGGMRMRASLARALVTDPQLLLLDEPFAALDEITRSRLDEQLRQLWLDRGVTVIFVTHSTAEATFLADRAVVLSQRPAQIVEDCPIDLPPRRHAALRAEPAFAAQMHILYDALQRGGA